MVTRAVQESFHAGSTGAIDAIAWTSRRFADFHPEIHWQISNHEAQQYWATLLEGRNFMAQKLAGKVAVVTGGNSGIGLATAKRFVDEGAYVFITGRSKADLDAAVEQVGANISAVRGDVSNVTDLDRLYATVKEQKGRIDILFANTGLGEFMPLGRSRKRTSAKPSAST